MKKRIKLRDLTPEQWDNNRTSLCNLFSNGYCGNCVFQWVGGCSDSFYRSSWINHKDCYSDKILDLEVEIEMPDILDEEEKRYLSAVIKPFKAKIISITKFGLVCGDDEYIFIKLINGEEIRLPRFKENTMYKEMEVGKHYTLEELGLVQKEYKITLTEFWNSKEKLAIHCNTEEKANKLLTLFDKMGKKWCSRESYLEINRWDRYKENTCYSNTHGYCYINFFKKNGYKVYEFKDVDFEE